MKNCMVISAVLAALLLTVAGCGEGPVFHENPDVLSKGGPGPGVTPELDNIPDDIRNLDPEMKKKREQQEEKEKKEEEKETERQDDIKDADSIADILIKHIYEGDFETALKKFEEHKEAFVKIAEENMIHENSHVREGYKLWMDEIIRATKILKDDRLTPEQKKKKAQDAIVNAGRGKQGAKLAKQRE